MIPCFSFFPPVLQRPGQSAAIVLNSSWAPQENSHYICPSEGFAWGWWELRRRPHPTTPFLCISVWFGSKLRKRGVRPLDLSCTSVQSLTLALKCAPGRSGAPTNWIHLVWCKNKTLYLCSYHPLARVCSCGQTSIFCVDGFVQAMNAKQRRVRHVQLGNRLWLSVSSALIFKELYCIKRSKKWAK